MKKVIISLIASLISFNCFSQLNPYFTEAKNDTIKNERDKNADRTIRLKIKIGGVNTVASNALTFTLNAAQTAYGICSPFAAQTINVIPGETEKESPAITILKGDNGGVTKYIVLQMAYNDGMAHQIKNVVIAVDNKQESKSDEKNSDDLDVSLLIGSNLDFFNTVKLKDLAGEFNIFLPKIFSITKKKGSSINVGANLGIYNYRNFSVDSPGIPTSINYKLVPFETLDPTKKIVKATFNTTGKSTRDFQGFYAEPVFSFACTENRKARLYFSFHFEMLKRTEKIEYDNPNYIWKDTVLYNAQRDNVVAEHSNVIRLNPSNTYYSSYYGVGFPVTVSKKYFELYFAATVGVSKYNVARYDTKAGDIITINNMGSFYLCKFFFKEKVSLLGLTIGGEIRGVFGKLNPYMNAYVATRISLNKFSDFFKTVSK
jgi:hypothetical protein